MATLHGKKGKVKAKKSKGNMPLFMLGLNVSFSCFLHAFQIISCWVRNIHHLPSQIMLHQSVARITCDTSWHGNTPRRSRWQVDSPHKGSVMWNMDFCVLAWVTFEQIIEVLVVRDGVKLMWYHRRVYGMLMDIYISYVNTLWLEQNDRHLQTTFPHVFS